MRLREMQRETRAMAKQVARRGSYRVIFGEGDQRYSLVDPAHPIIRKAVHAAHHAPLQTSTSEVMVLASVVGDMMYLVHGCPTTKEACEKLAALRSAVRKLYPNACIECGEATGPLDDDGRGECCSS